MASETHEVRLVGRDNVSRVFALAGQSGERAAKQIETGARSASRGLTGMSRAGAGVGAAFGALSGVLSDAARVAAEAEASQARLEQSIENTGHSLFEYADALDAASRNALRLGFDDEDAADSIALLTTVTGDATRAISDLSIAEDISRARKISLEQATKIVIAAEQGRFGQLARLGIAIDENATKEEALDALRAQFAGNAERYGETQAATFDRISNSAENLLESIGGNLGPMQTMIGLLPGLSAGWIGVSSVIGAVAPKMSAAGVASRLLSVAMGPAGIVAAAGLAAFAIHEVGKALDNSHLSASEARDSIEGFREAIATLGKSGASVETTSGLVGQLETLQALAETVAAAQSQQQVAMQQLTHAAEQENEAIASGSADALDAAHAATDAARDHLDAINANILKQDEFNEVQKDLVAIFSEPNPLNQGLVAARVEELGQAVRDGTIDARDYADAIDDLENESDSYGLTLEELAVQQRGVAEVTDESIAAAEKAAAATKGYGDALSDLLNPAATSTETLADIEHILNSTVPAADGARTALVKAFREVEAGTMTVEAFETRASTMSDTLGMVEEKARSLGGAVLKLSEDTASVRAAEADWAAEGAKVNAFLAEHEAALKEARGGYYDLMRGIFDADSAMSAFKETQDRLIEAQSVYSSQQSEYGGQLNALQEAEDLLNKRRADGIKLTKEQEDFLQRVDKAQARLTGGVEDAVLAEAELALAYADNMAQGDAMNQMLEENAGATGNLSDAIWVLIAALTGVPNEVSTRIELEADEADRKSKEIRDRLLAMQGYRVTTYIDTIVTGTIPAQGVGRIERAHGGLIPSSQHGRIMGGWSWVGEAGPELIHAPGSYVVPHAASMMTGQGNRGGPTYNFYGDLHIHASDPQAFADQLTAYARGGLS